MKDKYREKQIKDSKALRRKAEKKLKGSFEKHRELSAEESRALVHELQVHQIELEMQNEELRRSQGILEDSRSRYVDLYDFAPIGYATIDNKGRIVEINLNAATLLGVERSYLLNKPFGVFIHKEDVDKYHLHRQKTLTSKITQSCELRLVRKDKTVCNVELRSAYVEEIEKGTGRIQMTVLDITTQKLAINALRESEERLSAIFNQAASGIGMVSPEGKFFKVNRRFCEIVGYTEDEMIRKTYQEITHPDDLDIDMNKFRELLNGEIPSYSIEKRYIHRNGSEVWVNLTVAIVSKPSGEPDFIFGIIEDITERKKFEMELKVSEERFRGLFNTMRSGVAVYKAVDGGEDFVFTDYNPASESIDSVAKETIIGRRVTEIFPGVKDLGLFEVFQSVWKTGKSEYHPVSLYKDKRITGWRENYVYKLPSGELVAVYDDVTREKQAAQELKSANEELLRSNSDLEKFAFIASHDMKEPLRTITGFVNLLEKRFSHLIDKDIEEFIHFITDGTRQMNSVIDGLLAYSRIGSPGLEFNWNDINIIFKDALSLLEASVDESTAEVTCDPLPELAVDKILMTQLFQNLISNAICFRSKASPIIHISCLHEGSEWVFSVRDNGIGIPSEYREKVFEIFQRLHSREKYTGTGLGLAICKKIVELHEGRIWVESKPGKGSIFYFTIRDKIQRGIG